jgi:hypothetical protein
VPTRLVDGRLKYRCCGHHYRPLSAFDVSRLTPAVKRQLLEHFVRAGYRQLFRAPASRPAIERFIASCAPCWP